MNFITGPESWLSDLEIRNLTGLRPRAWLCVGPGYVREDLKTWLLQSGQGLVGDAVVSPQTLAARIAGVSEERILGTHARAEVLRSLLTDSRILARTPELRRLKRQSRFYPRLDRAVQAGRLAFSSHEEAFVFEQRLRERGRDNVIRPEVEVVAHAYETWLAAMGLWDWPMLLSAAIERLERDETALRRARLPSEIYWIQAAIPAPREQLFWDALMRRVSVNRYVPPTPRANELTAPSLTRWHSLEDAAEGLADLLTARDPASWSELAILIPDSPPTRRSLMRALSARGITAADPRDPTRVRSDEAIKWALQPLALAGGGYEREAVIAWSRSFGRAAIAWAEELRARGVSAGLANYAGGKLGVLREHLLEIERDLGGRKTLLELTDGFMVGLRVRVGVDPELLWLVPFFERFFKELADDLAPVGGDRRRVPARLWLERVRDRLADAAPPAERARPTYGVPIFRLTQAPLGRFKEVLIFGLPPSFLDGERVGDDWYNERDREVLGEFGVPSSAAAREQRLLTVRRWLAASETTRIFEAHYAFDGREQESAITLLRELVPGRLGARTDAETVGAGDMSDGASGSPTAIEIFEAGAHLRWRPSYGALRPVSPLEFVLPPARIEAGPYGKPELRATELDRYSRCGFQALAGSRWRLKDTRQPEHELWADERGILLHAAVRRLLETRASDGQFTLALDQAIDEAWEERHPRGLMRNARLARLAKQRLVPVLRAFCEAEQNYVTRAGTQVASLEGPELRMDFGTFSVKGIPDRIDSHPDGIFVLDYKTSSSLPKGDEMIELGYRLQLPFYAVAAQAQLGRPALGVQFVELNRKASRSSGIFFKQHNGKEAGKLTHTRARRSLFEGEPTVIWERVIDSIRAHGEQYLAGNFAAIPKKVEECRSCRFGDVCGRRRRTETVEVEGEAGV